MNNIRQFLDYTPTIADSAYIDSAATIIGEVNIGEQCSIWPSVVIRGDVNSVSIGHQTNIQDGSIIHVTRAEKRGNDSEATIIGDYVTVGHSVNLHGCTIKDHVLIGIGTTILDGAVVNRNVVIGAGSLVPPRKILESGFLYFGNPVKKARELTAEEIQFLTQSGDNYVALGKQYKHE
ncbi:gamma carbonic anhydrase family protein [Vibrio sp. SS-MA-C1-2]|uniref:gamma carbonic anhydrase family protein n=1 Tax=Vibrio sp. SS-MA-C1-2 TaxID=2908646 RepID=UPI001F3E36A4|nr:gamma carbonic anhydrase family protein [Vibrio sp. SS-MA-C1-2]UJF17567.1 gamma carbonic anhydrase family protein [Vibrio sp. SS-MA-C1-2]